NQSVLDDRTILSRFYRLGAEDPRDAARSTCLGRTRQRSLARAACAHRKNRSKYSTTGLKAQRLSRSTQHQITRLRYAVDRSQRARFGPFENFALSACFRPIASLAQR